MSQEQRAPANSCRSRVQTLAPTNKRAQPPRHAKPSQGGLKKAPMYMRCSCKGCRHSCTPCCRDEGPSEARSAPPGLSWSDSRAAPVCSLVHTSWHNLLRQLATRADKQTKHTANMHTAESQGRAFLDISNIKIKRWHPLPHST